MTEISNETATADPVSLSECENVEMNDVGIDTTDGAACNLMDCGNGENDEDIPEHR